MCNGLVESISTSTFDCAGYSENWTPEIFRVAKVQDTWPYSYLLEDTKDPPEAILGSFYDSELNLVERLPEDGSTDNNDRNERGNDNSTQELGEPREQED